MSRNDLGRLTEPELRRYRLHCNFSDFEREVFDRRSRGAYVYQIAAATHLSESAVNHQLREIRRKMRRLDRLEGILAQDPDGEPPTEN